MMHGRAGAFKQFALDDYLNTLSWQDDVIMQQQRRWGFVLAPCNNSIVPMDRKLILT